MPSSALRRYRGNIRLRGRITRTSANGGGEKLAVEFRQEDGTKTEISLPSGVSINIELLTITCLTEPNKTVEIDRLSDAEPFTIRIDGTPVEGALLREDSGDWVFEARDITAVTLNDQLPWCLLVSGKNWHPVPSVFRLVEVARYNKPS